ncbi:MAG: DegT/DnrJ/EryC1/StrS family aminotransferase [Anaerolineales bacterium]|jgi:perosamine synthetase
MIQKKDIPMSSPDISDAERKAVNSVLQTPYLSMGKEIEEFEKEFRNFTGLKNAIGVSSGTAGLHLCIRAANVSEDDLVITTPFSFVASTNVILYEKAHPIFVDIEYKTGNIDMNIVEEILKEYIKNGFISDHWLPRNGWNVKGELRAILVVDVFGQPAEYDRLKGFTKNSGIKIIEDSCEALGAEYKNQKAGTLGNFGVFGFYPNKQITTGEGGVIVTNENDSATLMRALRNQGRAEGDKWLNHKYLGYNYRLDEMSAALGRIQVTRLNELLEKRERVSNWYNHRLAEIEGIETPFLAPYTTRASWFVYVIRVDRRINRELLSSELRKRGIPSRPYFIPIHLQPYMVEHYGYRLGDFPITEDIGNRSLALPFSSTMEEHDVEYVCSALKKIISVS